LKLENNDKREESKEFDEEYRKKSLTLGRMIIIQRRERNIYPFKFISKGRQLR